MKSKDEVARLLWTLLGSVLGVAAGFALMAFLLPLLHLPPLGQTLAVIALLGGGLLGGGALALTILNKKQKAERKKYFDEKKARKKKRK